MQILAGPPPNYYSAHMDNELSPDEAHKLFVDQAAHLLLALAGVKPLPSSKAEPLSVDELLPPVSRKKLQP